MTTPDAPTQVAIIDPHPLTRDAVVAALEGRPGYKVLGAVDSISALHENGLQPDVLVTELFGVARYEQELEELMDATPTVVFTVATAPLYRIRCWLVGARAMISKTADALTLRNAIDKANRPRDLLDPALASAVLDYPRVRDALEGDLREFVELCRAGRVRAEIEKRTNRGYAEWFTALHEVCAGTVGARLQLAEPPFTQSIIGAAEPLHPVRPTRTWAWEIYEKLGMFSPAEKLVLKGLANGHTLDDIAKEKGRSKLTIKKQLDSALGKLYHRKHHGPGGAAGQEFTVEFGQLFALYALGELVNPEKFTRLEAHLKEDVVIAVDAVGDRAAGG